ncbi:MAG: winged helix-turn-helix domain-containing protein [Thermoanaerobaculia bacterium]
MERARTSRPAARTAAAPPTLDKLLHTPVRFGLVSVLRRGPLTFEELKAALGATDGNLSIHARKLEAAGYITCTKGFSARVPKTRYRVTPKGRRALTRYLSDMETILRGG